ncbi:hypothetical protein FB45DRAFT_363360 [Roridomyces roridus]|uniref:Uncharacterized protein n=1 Tax=Roridomyces roridus TaxID=1738132 RepID=A0AAD7C8Z0_9AGAR|nr:hypothetical protein FB45DRAFT_363360 [Roridomyces roridus]
MTISSRLQCTRLSSPPPRPTLFMQSLASESCASLVSWWSDSNPGLNGPTINLHTLTKPLQRFMYHRQALGYIKAGTTVPLTEATLDVYFSYLQCKYVATRTKVKILTNLHALTLFELEEGLENGILRSSFFAKIPQLLGSSNPDIRRETAKLIAVLARREASVGPIVALNLVQQLELMLHDNDTILVKNALESLTEIALWPLGAQAIAVSDALECTEGFLASRPSLRILAAILNDIIACHSEPAAEALIVKPNRFPFEQVASLLQKKDNTFGSVYYGLRGLQRIARSAAGAQLIMDTAMLVHVVVQLLGSHESFHVIGSCELISKLASHENIMPKLLKLHPLPKIVKLLPDTTPWAASAAVGVLHQISCRKLGAEAILETDGALASIPKLDFPSSWPAGNRKRDELLQNLAKHRPESTPPNA